MCVRWSIHQTLEVIKTLWRSDPRNPTIDHNMADLLLRANANILAEIRVTGETQLRPLGPPSFLQFAKFELIPKLHVAPASSHARGLWSQNVPKSNENSPSISMAFPK